MALSRKRRLDFKSISKYIYYINSSGKVIKEFKCPSWMRLRDKHYQLMLGGPSYFEK